MNRAKSTGAARPILLASASPRRIALLRSVGIPFETVGPRIDEVEEDDPAATVSLNAERKAVSVAGERPESWVIGADTVVALDGRIFGKPADPEDARRMLRELAGRTHEVLTGVCVVCSELGVKRSFVERSRVTMFPWDEERVRRYLERVDPTDKAGGYAIQEHGGLVVQSHEGDFTNIVGLPMPRLAALLREIGAV